MQQAQKIILLIGLLFSCFYVKAQMQYQPQRQSYNQDTNLYNKVRNFSVINYNQYSNFHTKNIAVK